MTEAAIADHGLIGDLQTAALVSTDGSVDWFCCPRFDSPSVFGALLDDDRGGHFRIRPARGGYETKQMYFPDTAVLITRFITENGVGEVVDFMPPSGREATDNHRLVRMVRCVRGEMSFEVEVAPRFDYGRSPHRTRVTEHGAVFTTERSTLTLHAVREPDDERLAHVRVEEGDVKLSIDLKAGRRSWPRAGVGRRRAAAGDPGGRVPADVRRHRRVLALLARPLHLYRALARDAAALGHHVEADDLRPVRWAGGGADRRSARADRRGAQLGLPLHLGARCLVLHLRAAAARLHRGSRAVQPLAAGPGDRAGRGRGWPAEHHVPGRRLLGPQGGVVGALVRLPRLAPGPHRQRRLRPAPARHLRRGAGQHLLRRPARVAGRAPRLDGDP